MCLVVFICIGIIILFLCCYPYIKYGPLKKNKEQNASALLVLGYPTNKDGSLSPILYTRVAKTVELYKKGKAPLIICSGGAVKNKHNEAETIAYFLKQQGIDSSAIICDKEAKNTYENICNTKKIMKERQLDSLIIVSSPWHIRQASIYLEKLKTFNYTVAACSIPKSLWIITPLIYLYCYYKIFKYSIRYI